MYSGAVCGGKCCYIFLIVLVIWKCVYLTPKWDAFFSSAMMNSSKKPQTNKKKENQQQNTNRNKKQPSKTPK